MNWIDSIASAIIQTISNAAHWVWHLISSDGFDSAVGGGVVALAAGKIYRVFVHPKIKLSFDASESCQTPTPDTERDEAFHIRLRVTNTSFFRETARSCYAYLVEVKDLAPHDSDRKLFRDILPLPWAGRQSRMIPEQEFQPIDIPVGAEQFFDVLAMYKKTIKKKKILNDEFRFTSRIQLLRYTKLYKSSSELQLKVMVIGKNFPPKYAWIFFRWQGWPKHTGTPSYRVVVHTSRMSRLLYSLSIPSLPPFRGGG